MEEKNMYRCPIRYYSIVTVPKDFISQETVIPPGKTEITEEEKEKTFRDIENREKEKSTYATVVNSLTPYAEAEKVIYPSGAYMYRLDCIYLQRK